MFLLRVATALRDASVPYAIAGGYAVALHGAVRGTVDIDLVINQREKDYVAVERALASIRLAPRLPVSAKEMFQFRAEYISKRNLLAWSFYNPSAPAELVDILIGEDLKSIKVETMHVQGELVRVISRKDLIRLKQKAGRAQDLEDVRALSILGKKR